jgi:hypothetical protein
MLLKPVVLNTLTTFAPAAHSATCCPPERPGVAEARIAGLGSVRIEFGGRG